jgi:hypothetical protein
MPFSVPKKGLEAFESSALALIQEVELISLDAQLYEDQW